MKKNLLKSEKPFCMRSSSLIFQVALIVTLILTMNISALAVSSLSLSERVTLQVNNVTLKDAFKEIEKQSEFTFLYNDASIDVNQVISVSTRELSIKDLLDEILNDRGIGYTIVDNQIVLTETNSKQAATKTVTGSITDSDDGSGLPGVTVLEKGTTNGTITDLDGNYSLTVAEDATLLVSYVGYVTEEVSVVGLTSLNLALIPDVISLEDVVVIGYGTVKKSDLTGAVASVSAEDLQQSAVSGVDQALQGRTAGVSVTANSGTPGAAPMVRIRGMSTVTSPDPLFVVDGMPVSAESVGSLNPGDIESTEILKDASAGAIYGARASNGVVLITTKRGKAGKSSVSYNTYAGIQQVAKKIELTNTEEFITLRNEAGATATTEDPTAISTNTDWQDVIFRDAHIQSHQLSFLGGSDMFQYAIVGSYYDQMGVIGQKYINDTADVSAKDAKGSSYNRYTLRVNTNANVKPWITVGQNLSISHSEQERIPEQDEYKSAVITSLTMDPSVSPVYPDSLSNPSSYYNAFPAATRNNTNNPYGIIMRNHDILYRDKVLGNVFVNIKPVEWLSFRTSLGAEITKDKNEQYLPEYNESVDATRPQSVFFRGWFNTNAWSWENTVAFSKTFGAHDLQVLAGYTREKKVYRYFGGAVMNVPNDPNMWLFSNSNPDPDQNATNSFEDYSDNIGGIPIANYVPTDWTMVSYLARMIYSYGSKYDLTASIRRDGSSRFSTNDKWGVFPSFAAGWKIHEEDFFKNVDAISFLKLRAGWGVLGNQAIPDYAPYTSVSYGMNYTLGVNQAAVAGGAPLSMGNNFLTWEESVMTNIGLDLNLWDNRLAMNVDYFVKNTTNMLVGVSPPLFVGVANAPYANRGEVQNSGVELNLTYKDKFGDFSYSINGNIAFLQNTVTSLPEDMWGAEFRAMQNGVTITTEGQPIASFWGYQTDGYWQNQAEIDAANAQAQATAGDEDAYFDTDNTMPGDIRYVDISGDDRITDEDMTFIGSPHPDLTYGINIDLKYKIVDLKIFGQGVQGNQVFYGPTYYIETPTGYFNMSTDMLDHWTTDGDTDALTPRLGADENNNMRQSDRYIYDGSYFRLKNVQLGVTLPEELSNKMAMERARFYIAAQNLLTISDYPGFDPEVGRGNNTEDTPGVLDIGVDRGLYPLARTFMIGLNLTF